MRRAQPRTRNRRGRPAARRPARAARRWAARVGFPLRVTGVGMVSIAELWPVADLRSGQSARASDRSPIVCRSGAVAP